MAPIIVMLVWAASAIQPWNGGGAAISGFGTVQACERAEAKVKAFYQGQGTIVWTKCETLDAE